MKTFLSSVTKSFLFSTVLMSLLFSSSLLTAENSTQILMYGSKNCGLCTSMKRKLDAEKIPYVFLDVNEDSSKNMEMWQKIFKAHGRMNSVRFPVMDINGEILVSAKFEEVKAKIGASKKDLAVTILPGDPVEIYSDTASNQEKEICVSLIEAGVSFKFINLKNNSSEMEILTRKIAQQQMAGKLVKYPVVIVKDKILMAPTSEEVKNLFQPAEKEKPKMETKPFRRPLLKR